MSSQRRPIPLYPNPPLSPQQTCVESASDEHSDFPPIRERNSTPNPTHVESASDEHSDFPPIRERNSTPDPPTSVLNHSHPRPPVTRRQSERHSSPSEQPAPSRYRRRHPPHSVGQRRPERRCSPSKEASPPQLQQYLSNSGLGNTNRLNTMEASTLVGHSKVRCQTLACKQLY